jgi:hypothetical protein
MHFERCRTAVAFMIFKRPDTTRRVFERIRQVRPPRLFVIADGPRQGRPGEAEVCQQTRAIIDEVDWDCDLQLNFADENLGLRQRISSGLDWVFGHVERAIVLEDDCVPEPSFFHFCDELLDRYATDSRVMSIAGANFQAEAHTPSSYYFSQYALCWGWATWRRAWDLFDGNIRIWPQIDVTDMLESRAACHYWGEVFDRLYQGEIDSWAYAWTFAHLVQHGLVIVPSHNLVSNVGFGADATHTRAKRSSVASLPTRPIQFPLHEPVALIRNRAADRYYEREILGALSRPERLARVGVKQVMRSLRRLMR